MFCARCGFEMPSGHRFCAGCGTPAAAPIHESAPAAPVQPPSVPTLQASDARPTKRARITALLLISGFVGALTLAYTWEGLARSFRTPTPTEFYDAVARGDLARVTRFINSGGDINSRDAEGFSALHRAAERGMSVGDDVREEILGLLLSKGADVNAANHKGATPLHTAMVFNNHKAGALFLAKGAQVNARLTDGRTALHDSVERGRVEPTEWLLSNGADANAKDNADRTPLHYAASSGLKELTRLLLARGARIDALDKAGKTPLALAVEAVPADHPRYDAFRQLADLLRQHGAK